MACNADCLGWTKSSNDIPITSYNLVKARREAVEEFLWIHSESTLSYVSALGVFWLRDLARTHCSEVSGRRVAERRQWNVSACAAFRRGLRECHMLRALHFMAGPQTHRRRRRMVSGDARCRVERGGNGAAQRGLQSGQTQEIGVVRQGVRDVYHFHAGLPLLSPGATANRFLHFPIPPLGCHIFAGKRIEPILRAFFETGRRLVGA
jgi:hypothetical protein